MYKAIYLCNLGIEAELAPGDLHDLVYFSNVLIAATPLVNDDNSVIKSVIFMNK